MDRRELGHQTLRCARQRALLGLAGPAARVSENRSQLGKLGDDEFLAGALDHLGVDDQPDARRWLECDGLRDRPEVVLDHEARVEQELDALVITASVRGYGSPNPAARSLSVRGTPDRR